MVAESLGLTPAGVRQAKSRVLPRLREELHQFLEPESGGVTETRSRYGLGDKEL